jgi:hypothetical protein
MYIIWVLFIGGGLYLRRFGPTAGMIGTALIILNLFGVILEPTRGEGPWMPLAASLGALAAGVVRFGAYRPSAVAAYDVERARFHRFAGEGLADLAAVLRAGRAEPIFFPTGIRNRWSATAKAMQAAALESPPRADLFRNQTATDYRLVLAAETMAEAMKKLTAARCPGALPTKHIADVIDKVAVRAADLAEHRPTPSSDPKTELEPVRESVPGSDLPRAAKLHALRFLAGLVRLDRALDPPPASPAKTASQEPSASPHAKKIAGRLALQGLVAGGITAVLALYLRLDHAYWATLTVALVLAGTMGETLHKTLRRAVGTAVGVLIAIVLAPVLGGNPLVGLPLVLLAVGAVMVFLDTRYGIASGLIGFAVVFGLHLAEHATVGLMLARIYETFIGAGVALLVAFLVVPVYSADQIEDKLRRFLAQCRECFETIRESASEGTDLTSPLAESLRALMGEAPALEAERLLGRQQEGKMARALVLLEALLGYLGLFERSRAAFRLRGAGRDDGTREILRELDERILSSFDGSIEGERASPDFSDLVDRIAEVAPLDGSRPPAEDFLLVEQLYYGRRMAETLRDLNHG